mmetsp:Transcript_8160/g.18518  ORF Transcript_8160/g.18518 Transcript_8160/m.18518 type:complete len:429 (+) Transcript_8160:771-2057(+)
MARFRQRHRTSRRLTGRMTTEWHRDQTCHRRRHHLPSPSPRCRLRQHLVPPARPQLLLLLRLQPHQRLDQPVLSPLRCLEPPFAGCWRVQGGKELPRMLLPLPATADASARVRGVVRCSPRQPLPATARAPQLTQPPSLQPPLLTVKRRWWWRGLPVVQGPGHALAVPTMQHPCCWVRQRSPASAQHLRLGKLPRDLRQSQDRDAPCVQRASAPPHQPLPSSPSPSVPFQPQPAPCAGVRHRRGAASPRQRDEGAPPPCACVAAPLLCEPFPQPRASEQARAPLPRVPSPFWTPTSRARASSCAPPPPSCVPQPLPLASSPQLPPPRAGRPPRHLHPHDPCLGRTIRRLRRRIPRYLAAIQRVHRQLTAAAAPPPPRDLQSRRRRRRLERTRERTWVVRRRCRGRRPPRRLRDRRVDAAFPRLRQRRM